MLSLFQHNYFLTGGEGGIITLWRGGDAEESADATQTIPTTTMKAEVGKSKRSSKAHKSKPY